MIPDINLRTLFDRASAGAIARQDAMDAANETATGLIPFRRDPLLESLGQTAKLMIVDDEPVNVKVIRKHLKLAGYRHFVTSTDSTTVMKSISKEMPDVVLIDIMMPHVSGLEILQMARDDERLSHIPIIVLTASDNDETKMEALKLGAAEFLCKPVNASELIIRVRNALLIKVQRDRLKNHARDLECQVQRRTAELAASRLELIHCLARAAEFRDNETGHHVVRVGRYAELIARALGLEERFVELIGHAAPLHDMGKVGIPDSVLMKPGKLAPDEFEIMRKHSVFGKRTFKPMSSEEYRTFESHTFMGEKIMDAQSSPIITVSAAIALTHHEKWDGTGYPLGLKGERIPLVGRITAVADVFDALSSKRPYKPAFELDRCFEIIEEGRGAHFDPRVLDAFLACREAVTRIYTDLADGD